MQVIIPQIIIKDESGEITLDEYIQREKKEQRDVDFFLYLISLGINSYEDEKHHQKLKEQYREGKK